MKTTLYRLLFCLLCGATAARAEWRFAKAAPFRRIELSAPILDRAEALPVKPPVAHTYLPVRTADTLIREDRFSPYELWYTSQHIAQWMNVEGDSLILASVDSEFPDFPIDPASEDYRHVEIETFQNEIRRDKWAITRKDVKKLKNWMADFVPAKIFSPEKLDINSRALEEVLRFPNDKGFLLYACLPRHIGKRSESKWLAVIALPGPANRGTTAQDTFENRFLGEIKILNPKEARKTVENALDGTEKNKSLFAPHHVRQFAAKSIECHDNWWKFETEGYVVLSDLYSAIGKSVMRDLEEYLPAFRSLLRETLPPMDTLTDDVFLIRIFSKRESYLRYAGKDMQWSGAYWDPRRRELVMHHSGGEKELMPTLLHEATHQYLSFAYAMILTSPWFNEGHACLFGRSVISKKKKAKVEIDERFAELLAADPETTALGLQRLLELDYEGFYASDAAERTLNYATAWGLCFYLHYGIAADNAPSEYGKIIPAYVKNLAKTRDPVQATSEAFSQIDLNVFAERFAEFWGRSGLAHKALRLEF